MLLDARQERSRGGQLVSSEWQGGVADRGNVEPMNGGDRGLTAWPERPMSSRGMALRAQTAPRAEQTWHFAQIEQEAPRCTF